MNPTPKPNRGANRWTRLFVVLAAIVFAATGCKTNTRQAGAPGLPGGVVTQTSWAPDVLEQLLAPIALYPDELVGMILAASVNSQEVLDAGNWLLANQDLKGDALDAAAKKAGFGAPMRGLVRFPTVVDMMCQELEWTRQLGSAFTSDQKGVLDAVQRLRASAVAVGSLQSGPQQTVAQTTEHGTTVIEVKSADPQVIYVPQYDPQVVYATPPPAAATTTPAATTTTPAATTTQSSSDNSALKALVMFGIGVAVGNAMHDDDYYCYPHYGAGCVYVGRHPYYPPAYVYRPAHPPAHAYRPPPGYPHAYNRQVNVTINNRNYYNQFNNNANLKRGAARSPMVTPTQTAARAGGRSAWKGQSAYAGAQPAGQRARAPAAAASPLAASATPASRRPEADRGYGAASRAGVESSTRGGASVDGGRSAGGAGSTRPAQVSSSASPSRPDNAFSGAGRESGGSFDQAASARGRASTSGSSGVSRLSSSGDRSGGRRKR